MAKTVVIRVQIDIEEVEMIPKGFSVISRNSRQIGGEISSAISKKAKNLGSSFSQGERAYVLMKVE